MKNYILIIGINALIIGSTLFTSCKKPDKDAPVITLNGNASITISLQGTYTELNATARDEKDGDITPTLSGTVNVNHTGSYTITYRATDAAGNISTAIRTVTVVNEVAAMNGYYICSGSTNYNDTITSSPIKNNRIHFGKFGNYQGNKNIYADITGTAIALDSIFAVQVGSPAFDRSFKGTGLITSATVFSIDYTETSNGSTTNKSEIFTKQ